jgi:hypothetical protein
VSGVAAKEKAAEGKVAVDCEIGKGMSCVVDYRSSALQTGNNSWASNLTPW